MCISNIGNRRPFPSHGFRNCPASATLDTTVLKATLDGTSAPCQSSKNPHIVVQHDYHDHAQDARVNYQEHQPARGGVTVPFPLKLHDMLNEVGENGHELIVSWQPHGRCFVVHKPKEFVELLPQYFKLSKLASFQRQLNLWGFQRLTRGRDRGGYYHELFLRDRVFLAHSIQRVKVKGTGVRARSNPHQEPCFWSMPWVQHQGAESRPKMVAASFDSNNSCNTSLSSSESYQQEMTGAEITGLPASFFAQKFPLHLEPTALPQEFSLNCGGNARDDDALFGKHFFDVEPSINLRTAKDPQHATFSSSLECDGNDGDDEFLAKDIDAFFDDFDFPDDIGIEIEDDLVFGDLLEQLIT